MWAFVSVSCAQKPPPQPKKLEFEESAGSGEDASTRDRRDTTEVPARYADACEQIARYNTEHGELGALSAKPRVDPADDHSWAPDGVDAVVFHTLEESIGTEREWAPHVRQLTSHLAFSIKGRDPGWGSSDQNDIPPVKPLVEIVDHCDVKRGLFRSLDPRFTRDGRLHLFECSRGMASLREKYGAGESSMPTEIGAAWKVGGLVVKCQNPPILGLQFVGADIPEHSEAVVNESQLAPDLQSWFQKILDDTKAMRALNRAPSERAFDWAPLIDRHFYLAPLDRSWNTKRMMYYLAHDDCPGMDDNMPGYDDDCSKVVWRGPFVYRHWYYHAAYKSDFDYKKDHNQSGGE